MEHCINGQLTVSDDEFESDISSSQLTPVEAVSRQSRVRLHLHIKTSLHKELSEIAEAEDSTIAAVTKRALHKFVRQYKENGNF